MEKRERHLRQISTAVIVVLATAIAFFNPPAWPGIPSFTGKAVIGLTEISDGMSFMIILLLISVAILGYTGAIDEIVEKLHHKIEEQRRKFQGSLKFIRGLKDVEEALNRDRTLYDRVVDARVKEKIEKRIVHYENLLGRREEFFFNLPHHVEGVMDLPDRGLYEYKPLGGRGTRMIELQVTHYTNGRRYHEIQEAWKKRENQIMMRDQSGWAYFVKDPLPIGMKTRDIRRVLGTGLQDYAPLPKTEARNPEYAITFTVRVPKERLMVRKHTYRVKEMPPLTVTKYAVAGGLRASDIVGHPIGQRYLEPPRISRRKMLPQIW